MLILPVRVDPPKSRCFLPESFDRERSKWMFTFNIVVKCKFRPRRQANCHAGVPNRGEPTRDGVTECRRRELIAYLRRAVLYAFQTVVAHVRLPFCPLLSKIRLIDILFPCTEGLIYRFDLLAVASGVRISSLPAGTAVSEQALYLMSRPLYFMSRRPVSRHLCYVPEDWADHG